MKIGLRINVFGALLLTALMTASAPETPVADAAERGDLETVRSLLRQGADVNAAQGDGMSALHWAAMNDNAEMAGVLLYAGAQPRATTRLGGFTALHLAGKSGHADVIRVLLEEGADVAAVTSTGVTAMHYAAASGRPDAVKALLAYDAEVDPQESTNQLTPLMWATASNRVDAMAALLEGGADPSLTSRAVDFTALARLDKPDQKRRERLLAAQRALDEGVDILPAAPPQQSPRAGQQPTEEEEQAGQQPTEEEEEEQVSQPPTEDEEEEQVSQPPTEDEEEGQVSQPPTEDEEEEQVGQPPTEDEEEEQVSQPPTEDEEEEQVSQPPTEDEQEEQVDQEPTTEEEQEEIEDSAYDKLVGSEGGFTALHFASRDGFSGAAQLLLDYGADIDQGTAGDGTSPLLMATINGEFDLAMLYLEQGADPNLVAEDGVAPLFQVLNRRWAPKAGYPQPDAFRQQETDYLDLMRALLEAGADVDARTGRHVWYTSFNFDMLGVDFTGATAFWRAAYGLDLEGMRLLVSYGADASIPTTKVPKSRYIFQPFGTSDTDLSGLEPVPVGGPAVYPIHAASGVGYGQGFASNSHTHAPDSWLPAVQYLVEELGADVDARDHDGYSPVHHAAARGDNEVINYLISKGADVTFMSRRGETTVDMANGPRQRIEPFPETIALLEGLGAINKHNCQSCE